MPLIEPTAHHVHLNAQNASEAANWYARHLGGSRHSGPGLEVLQIAQGPPLLFNEAAPSGPSQGTVADHLGVSVSKLEPVLEAMCADSGTFLNGPRVVGEGELKIAFLDDPFGCRLELMEDHDLYGAHHVHWLAPDPLAAAHALQEVIGGTVKQYNNMLPGLDLKTFWVLFRESTDALEPTVGRALDHIGLQITGLDQACETLEGASIQVLERGTRGGFHTAFFETTGGARIELIEPESPVNKAC